MLIDNTTKTRNVFSDPFDYTLMVESLFKKMGNTPTDLMHAAVGACGESIELFAADLADDQENIKEELGDLLFYIEMALILTKDLHIENAVDLHFETNRIISEDQQKFGHIVDRIVYRAGDLLDLTKKTWIYEKPINALVYISTLSALRTHVSVYMTGFGWTNAELQLSNRDKLSKRYPNGVYSNKDAQERKDKV